RAQLRPLFRADALPAEDASTVADLLHHRLRRGAAVAVIALGIFQWRHAQARRADGGDPALWDDLPLDAGLSLLQPRHRADRPQSLGALPAPARGVRPGAGDPAPR